MGIVPLSWQEIIAWKDAIDISVTPFEMSLVRILSKEYCEEYYAASDKDRPAPYDVVDDQIDRDAISNKVKNVLSGFKKN